MAGILFIACIGDVMDNRDEVMAVMMTRVAWTAVLASILHTIQAHITESDSLYGEKKEQNQKAIRDYVQTILPLLKRAATTQGFPELKPLFNAVVQESGFAIPEVFEESAKYLVRRVVPKVS